MRTQRKLLEAWRRLADAPEIATGLMLAVALLGLAANAVSLFLLRNAQGESLNITSSSTRAPILTERSRPHQGP